MLAKLKFGMGLILAATLVAIGLNLSLKTRAMDQPVGLPDALRLVYLGDSTRDAAVKQSDIYGPDTRPIAEAVTQDLPPEFPIGRSFSSSEVALLDSLDFADVRDVKLSGSRILLATAGGVVEFFSDDSSFSVYSYPQGLENHDCYSVLPIGEDIYVGTGAGVYKIDGIGVVSRIWRNIDDTVMVLKHFGRSVHVGTKSMGLYLGDGEAAEHFTAAKSAIDIEKNKLGLWIASSEEGLLHSPNGYIHKRYFQNDSTALAEVTCLASACGRLWVGTPKGVLVYDGGRWERIDSTTNLFDQNVTALTVGRKFIYIGTACSGLFSYYDGALSPLDWSEGLAVSSVDVDNGNYLVGLRKGGAILKTTKGELGILSTIKGTQTILSRI